MLFLFNGRHGLFPLSELLELRLIHKSTETRNTYRVLVEKIFGKKKRSLRRPRSRWLRNVEIFCMINALWRWNPQHRAQWRFLVEPWAPANCCFITYGQTVKYLVQLLHASCLQPKVVMLRCAIRQVALWCVAVDGESQLHCFLP